MNCPKCESDKIVKNGMQIMKGGMKQRHACKSCGHTFVMRA